MTNWRFSGYANRLAPSAIRALAELPRAADTIAFGPGEPDAALFPLAGINDAMARILADPAASRRALQYGPSEGDPRLRELIAARMSASGVRCSRDNILLTNGSQQALHLAAALLVEPGGMVAVQAPTYPGALQIFGARGAHVRSIEEIGRDPSARPALLYAMANFQNPTGRSLDLGERHALLALAEARGAILVEDDPYEALRFAGDPPPPLLSLDARGLGIDAARALYLGTFSKSVVPGFRIGWVVGPRAAIAAMALMKQTEDLQAGTFAQACLADLLETGLEPHTERLRAAYRRRRDAMIEALAGAAGNLATWTAPKGGFFVWLALPDGHDTVAMLPEAARNGVTYVPGPAFFHDGSGASRLRLSYSSAPPERIGEGIRRLAETIRAHG
jgi:DNA-binding transcriptional MocR family regulator